MKEFYWEYTRTNRFHWIDDGTYYKPGKWDKKVYELRRWAIVDCADYGIIHSKEDGYDLWHKGKLVKHAKTVKELKEYVVQWEKTRGNKIVMSVYDTKPFRG